MSTPNLVYIQSFNAAEFQWFDGHTTQWDSLETIAVKLPIPEVIIILSGTQVYLTKVELLNTTLTQLQRAAPFALEEELAEDIETLHFAYTPIIKNQPTAVAIINKALLSAGMARFKEHGLIVQACYIAPLLLPINENHLTCAILENQALVKISNYYGFSVPVTQVELFMETQLGAGIFIPEIIDYYDFATEKNSVSAIAGIPVQYIPEEPIEFLPMLAKQIADNQYGINLMQTEFKVVNKLNNTKKAWGAAGIAFAAWLLISMIMDVINYGYYSHQQNKLQQQIDKIYMQIFPQATAIVSPKIRIERELQQYQQAGFDNGFLSILQKIAPILINFNNVTVENLTYQNQQLLFNVRTGSFQELQNFSKTLSNTGLIIQQTDANDKGKFVIAAFSIKFPNGEL